MPFADKKIRLLEILIKEDCELINIKLNELTKKFPNLDANIIAIIRNGKFFIPKKTDTVKKDDKIFYQSGSASLYFSLKSFTRIV